MGHDSPARAVCIHGHFYQPPRENAWSGEIDAQESARPFHDWNERINAECYGPNARARILNAQGLIQAIVNNYQSISFDFGPTLLSWLAARAPATYGAVLAADQAGGGGMAQAYNHTILPLANARDRETQVLWGMRDFAWRFGREAAGMWLPETAVDMATLEALAAAGVRFTVLAPHQAGRVRKFGNPLWRQLSGDAGVDTRRAYQARLPSGRTIAIFFYDGGLAHEIAFGGLLRDGEALARRLVADFTPEAGAQLAHFATDGESYGHHHRFGEMGLAAALRSVELGGEGKLTNYQRFLDAYGVADEVEIVENTSWSCVHGIERWRADCGCNSGGKPGWRQTWRAPLRAALDWLRDALEPIFEREAGRWLREPWVARNHYIDVVLDPQAVGAFLDQHARAGVAAADRARAIRLLEMQRFAMLMYTSCGWFFDEVSGIETAQILQYAARALELAEQTCGVRLRSTFLERLEPAPCNVAQFQTARGVYEQLVEEARGRALGTALTAASQRARDGAPGAWHNFLRLARQAQALPGPVPMREAQDAYASGHTTVPPTMATALGAALGFAGG